MEFATLSGTTLQVSRVGLGTWAMGGWMWGGTDERESIRTLGRTGEKVSLVGLRGYHLGTQADEQESLRLIRTAIDNGVNFMDNGWDYNDGASELRCAHF
jgi:aryl-alcohol dehydrogenase-like predicted oxidoreductase